MSLLVAQTLPGSHSRTILAHVRGSCRSNPAVTGLVTQGRAPVSSATVTHSSENSLAFNWERLCLAQVARGCSSGCTARHGAACVWMCHFYDRAGARCLTKPQRKASPVMWQVSHLVTFYWPKLVPWPIWTVGLEVYSSYQDALQVM